MASPARASQQPERYTIEEYLRWERQAEVRSEYYDGQIVMMAGGSPEHSRIAASLIRHLGNALDGYPCSTYTSDLKVRSSPTQFVYPDVTVVRGDLEFQDDEKDVVTNPRLVVEVMSPSTEYRHRHVKWLRYQQLPSLTDYLLVWQVIPAVEHFFRGGDDGWRYVSYQGLEAELSVPALNCRIPLRQIYSGIDFPTADEDAPG